MRTASPFIRRRAFCTAAFLPALLSVCSVALSQQIPCPVASDYTNAASAFNAKPSCNIQVGVTLANAAGGTLLNQSGAALANDGALRNAPGGALVNDGELDNDSSAFLVNAGAFANNAGATIVNNSGDFLQGFENQSGGTITNAGSITNNVYLQNDTGAMLFNAAGGSIVNNASVLNNGRLEDESGATITNNTDLIDYSGATLAIQPGGTLANTTPGSLFNVGGTITNNGLIANNGSLDNESGELVNGAQGTIVVSDNAILNEASLINEGSMTVAWANPGFPFFVATVANDGGTFLNATSATLTVGLGGEMANSGAMGATNNGTIVVQGLLWNLEGATFTNNGTISGDTGVLQNDGVFINDGAIAPPSAPSADYDYYIENSTTGTLSNNGAMIVGPVGSQEGILINEGSFIDNAGSTVDVEGSFLNSGSIENAAGATITNDNLFSNDGLLTNRGMLIDNGAYFSNEGFATLLNAVGGTLVVGSAGVLSNGAAFDNAGTLAILPGGVFNNSLTSTFTQASGQTVVDGVINSDVALQVQGGTLSGTGTINGNVDDSGGDVEPGDGPGTLTINGDYMQGSSGTLTIELFGGAPGELGLLAVSGLATLDGTLDLVAEDGFTPEAGDDFTFLLFGSLSGDFASIDLTDWTCPAGDTCSEVVGANSLSYDITGPGQGGGGGGGAVSVPEPTTMALFALGLVFLFGLGRKRHYGLEPRR